MKNLEELINAVKQAINPPKPNMPGEDRSYWYGPSPKFDAVESIITWIGRMDYPELRASAIKIDCTVCFIECCEAIRVKGFPVEAWYDHFQGEGKFNERYPLDLEKHRKQAFELGIEAEAEAHAKREAGEPGPFFVEYDGPMPDIFEEGMRAGAARREGEVQ